LPQKTRILFTKVVIPLIAKIRDSIASGFEEIRSLRKIMYEFESQMTEGQKETMELLGKTIKEKGKLIEENVGKDLEKFPEMTLLRYARIGNENENMVAKLLKKIIDSDGNVARIDFENCLVEIAENLELVESEEIDLTQNHNGSEVLSKDGKLVVGWVYNSVESPNKTKIETSEVLEKEKESERNRQVRVISINLAGANNHENEEWTQARIDKYNDKIRSILTELERISSQNKKQGISTVFFCQEVPFDKNSPFSALNLGEEIAKLGGTAIFALQENCGNQVAIITMEPNILPNQRLKIIPTNKIGDFNGFMKMPEKIAIQTLVGFQIEINGEIIQVSGTHQLAPTSIAQRIISRVVEMALIHAKIIEFAIGDENSYGISVNKPFFENGSFIVPNLPYAFLVSIVMIIISNFLSDLAKNSNSEKWQNFFQKFNKNLGEIKIVQQLANLVRITCPIPKEPTFGVYGISAHRLDMAMASQEDLVAGLEDLKSGGLIIDSVPLTEGFSDHLVGCQVTVTKNSKKIENFKK